jgi:hypothetical protein
MTREEILTDQLDEIMDSFRFDKVIKIMSALNWKWVISEDGGVPNQREIRKEARRIMKVAIKEKFCAIGGFRSWVDDGTDNDGPWTRLNLFFGIEATMDGENHS